MTTAEDTLRSDKDEFHLACLLLSPSGRAWLTETLDQVSPDDFHDPHYGALWADARALHARGQPITRRTLLSCADNPARRAKLDYLAGEPVLPAQLGASVRAVRDTARLRRLVQAGERIKNWAVLAEDYTQALGVAWDVLAGLETDNAPADVTPFAVLVDDWHARMAAGPRRGDVVPTPWPDLNDLLDGGLRRGRSYLVAARPNEGKSIVLGNVAAHAAEQGSPALIVSQEMSGFEMTGRLLAAGARAEYREINRWALSYDTQAAIASYSVTHRDMPLYVVDKPDLPVEHVAALARTAKRAHGLDVLAVDYLQLLAASDKRKSEYEQLSHISRSLKALSRELDCAVVSAAQLNRQNTRERVPPLIKDLKGSGSLEQDADGVILIRHELTEEGHPSGMVTLVLAKHRMGRPGEVTLPWRGHQARIGD